MPHHSVLLGGLGGDSHSVGLILLKQALAMQNFDVLYIGTQNSIDVFFEYAPLVNVVLVSCMDGHAKKYLKRFPELYSFTSGDNHTVWFLGGNPSVEKFVSDEKQFQEMGFYRVFMKYVEVDIVLHEINVALCNKPAKRIPQNMRDRGAQNKGLSLSSIPNANIDSEEFIFQRQEVLTQWHTGERARDLEDNALFLRAAPNWTLVQTQVNLGKLKILIQPRTGVPTESKQLELLKVYRAAGATALSFQVDSYTRNNNYVLAEEALREAERFNYPTMNGFPIVNLGVEPLRRITRALNAPLQTRHSTRDPRLLCEISLAGGATAFEGGAICYNLPYYRDYPLAESITAWRYVDHLTGYYAKKFGIVIDREFFGTLTATLIPPSIALATQILEAILAAQQGVQAISLGWAEQGCRYQDIAAIRSIRPLAHRVLENFGYGHMQISSVYHQYMAAFPSDQDLAQELIYNSSVTAALSKATRMIIKTPAEALRVPERADNLKGIEISRLGIEAASRWNFDETAIQEEMMLIQRETLAIIDAVIAIGRGNIGDGIIKAFRRGVLDIPFSPSIHNRGEVMCARAVDQAIRFINCGHIPLDKEVQQFHSEVMSKRRQQEGLRENQNYILVAKDLTMVPNGKYECWPLNNS